MYKVLIVDDEKWVQNDLATVVDWNSFGFDITAFASNVDEAIKAVDSYKPDVICLDIMMPGLNGIDFLKYLKEYKYNVITILISAYGEFKYAKQAIYYGAFEYLLKPVDEDELEDTLKRVREILDDTKGVMQTSEIKEEIDLDKIRTTRYPSIAVNEALDYIEEHFNEKISIADVANMHHFNVCYFGNLFKKNTGISFTGYIVNKRLKKAEKLLKETDYPISEISAMVGYDDVFHFSKLFKKYKNISPSDYRKQL